MPMVIISCIRSCFSIWIIPEFFIQVKVMNLVLFIKVYLKKVITNGEKYFVMLPVCDVF